MSIIFTAIFSGIELIWDRQFGFLKETLVAPVSRMNIMIGRTLGGATVATFQGIIVFLIAMFFGFRPDIGAGRRPLFSCCLSRFSFTALGTAIASMLEDMQGFQLIMNFLVMPLFFLSGALFPLTTAPAVMRWIAFFNPFSYGVDGLRGGFHRGVAMGRLDGCHCPGLHQRGLPGARGVAVQQDQGISSVRIRMYRKGTSV